MEEPRSRRMERTVRRYGKGGKTAASAQGAAAENERKRGHAAAERRAERHGAGLKRDPM